MVAAAAINVVTLNRDARLMRNEILSTIEGHSHTQVQLSVGPTILSGVRLGLAFSDQIPREAKLAVNAVRSASVGVYELSEDAGETLRAKMFVATDQVMRRRGWTRVVVVNSDGNTVLIYMPENATDHGRQRVCLAVCERDKLVIVSATADTASLVDLVAAGRSLAQL